MDSSFDYYQYYSFNYHFMIVIGCFNYSIYSFILKCKFTYFVIRGYILKIRVQLLVVIKVIIVVIVGR